MGTLRIDPTKGLFVRPYLVTMLNPFRRDQIGGHK